MSEWTFSRSALHTSSKTKPLTTDQLLSDLEVDFALQDSERSLQSLRQSSQTLRQELETLSHKRLTLKKLQASDSQSSRTPQTSPRIQEEEEDLEREEVDLERKEEALAVEDYISHEEVLDFMRNYLPGKTKIATEEFLSCLELDFPEELSVSGFADELARKIAGDSGWVSLNRLQAFTKKDGLSGAIRRLAADLVKDSEDSQKHMNAEIVSEMAELSRILEAKTKTLSQSEAHLHARERDLAGAQRKAMTALQASAQSLTEKALQDVKSAALVHIKRLQRLERQIGDTVKLGRAKGKEESEKPRVDEGRLKARIAALEKTNEALKAKVDTLEGELNSHKTQVQRLSEDLGRSKAKCQQLEQLANDCKAQLRDTPPTKPQEPAPIAEPQREEEQTTTSEAMLAISVVGMLLTQVREGVAAAAPQESRPKVQSLGGILYPFFSELVPKLVEILPIALKAKSNPTIAEEIVDLLHSLIATGFIHSFAAERYPGSLDFRPCTEVWRRKQASKEEQKVPEHPALYQLFSAPSIQQIAITFIAKCASAHPDSLLAVKSAVLSLLLSTSQKRQEAALRTIKANAGRTEVGEWLLTHPSRSLLAVLVTMRSEQRAVATLAGEVVLAVTVQREFAKLARDFQGETKGFQAVIELAERVLGSGEERSDLEDYMVLLLQKLTSNHVLTVHKRDPLTVLLIARVRTLQVRMAEPEVKFILENMSSILQHAK